MNSFNGAPPMGPPDDDETLDYILDNYLYLDAVGVYWDPDTDNAYDDNGNLLGNFVELFGDDARALDPESFGIMDENEYEDLDDILFRFIRHTAEYKECETYDEPQCMAALADAAMDEENLDADLMRLVISYDDVTNSLNLRGYHPLIGPVWSEVSKQVCFPSDYVEFSNAILDIHHHCEIIRNLTHGCPQCWQSFNMDPLQEIAEEYSCEEELVEDLREAQRDGEIKGYGAIQPDCPVCCGVGIDAFGGMDTL